MATTKPKASGEATTPVEVKEPATVTLSTADLQNIINGAVTAALGAVKGGTAPQQEKVATVAMQRRLAEEQRRYAHFHEGLVGSPEHMTTVEIPAIFRKYLGGHLTVTWNGSVIKVPVDGKRYQIHKGFKPIIMEKIRHVSEKAAREQHQDDVTGQQGDIQAVSR